MKKFFIGVDVSKETIDVSCMDPDWRKTPEYVGPYQNSPSGFRNMVKDLRKLSRGVSCGQWQFCCETTGAYDLHLCYWIAEHGMHIWRESALQVKWSSGVQRRKSDIVDSKVITMYAWRFCDKANNFVKPCETLVKLKELYSHRESLTNAKKGANNRLQVKKRLKLDANVKRLIVSQIESEINSLSKKIEKTESMMLDAVKSDKDIYRNYKHIVSIKGIGMITACALIIYSGNFRAINKAEKMACYLGIAAFRKQSGTSVDYRANVSNLSNRRLKGVITMAARSAARSNKAIKAYYERLLKRGKVYGIAINNVKNKLLHMAFMLVERDIDFDEELCLNNLA